MTRPLARTIYLIKRAETACRSGLDTCLVDTDITPAQYTTMSLLAQASQSSASLARRAGVSAQSMGEIIAILERKGLVTRSENPEHRRILTVSLTDKGREALDQCDDLVSGLENRLLEGLEFEQIEVLRKALDVIARNSDGRPA